MSTFASELINVLGGTAKVASLAEAPMSTVHNMRRRLTDSRLNHLRRIAEAEGLSDLVYELARQHGVVLRPLRGEVGEEVHDVAANCVAPVTSSGKVDAVSARIPA